MKTYQNLVEKAKSVQQQQLMGLALAYKRGEVPASKVSDTVKKMSKSMSDDELAKYAGTKHKGLPQKVANEAGKPPVPEIGTKALVDRYAAMTPGQDTSVSEAWTSGYDNIARTAATAAALKYGPKLGKAAKSVASKISKAGQSQKPDPSKVAKPTAKKPVAAKKPATPKKTGTAAAKPTATATGTKKKELSQTPNAIRKRAARAKATAAKKKAASPQGKSPMPPSSKFSDLRRKQQARAKMKMGSKGVKK